MSVIHVILSIIYGILGVAISVVILMQEGKSNGLGGTMESPQTVTGVRTGGRSMEGCAEPLYTRYGAIAFMLITIA